MQLKNIKIAFWQDFVQLYSYDSTRYFTILIRSLINLNILYFKYGPQHNEFISAREI